MKTNVLDFRTPDPERPPAHFGGALVNFQPSEDVRKRYFSTRKHSFSLAGVTFPGLFSKPPESDIGWFKIAVLIEVVTAFVLSAIVVTVYSLPPWSGLLPFLGFVGIDVALAILHHWHVPLSCLHKNQELLVVPDLRAGLRRVETKYGDFLSGLKTKEVVWQKWLSTFSVALILVVAAAKTLFLSANIQELGSLFGTADAGNIFDSASPLDGILRQDEYRSAILVIFSLLYCLVAYIHIKHTGYALASINLIRGLKRDSHHRASDPTDKQFHCVAHEERINLLSFAKELSESSDPFFSQKIPAKESLLSHKSGFGLLVDMTNQQQSDIAPHSIEAKGDGTYVMIRRGMLTDEQLRAWVNMQETEFAGRVIALYGHKLQMNLVGAEDIDKDIF